MDERSVVFRVHAIQRMYQRGIDASSVRQVIRHGEAIEEYPEDLPYPSKLMYCLVDSRPIHVVMAENPAGNEAIVITVYEPDATIWEADFKKRRR